MNDARTIGEVSNGPATYIQVECLEHWVHYGGCWHSTKWSLVHAIVEWGAERRLSTMRFVCTGCGSRRFAINFRHPKTVGGHEIWPAMEHHYQMSAHRWRHLETQLARQGTDRRSAVATTSPP